MRPEAELWWRQARRDYRTAKNCHASRDYYAAVFFCQQAVEKALTAAVVHRVRELPPRTHNLVELGDIIRVPKPTRTFLMELTPQYVVTRYPGAAGGPIDALYNGYMSRGILRRTQRLLQWVGTKLRK